MRFQNMVGRDPYGDPFNICVTDGHNLFITHKSLGVVAVLPDTVDFGYARRIKTNPPSETAFDRKTNLQTDEHDRTPPRHFL